MTAKKTLCYPRPVFFRKKGGAVLDIHPVWFLTQMGSFLVFLYLMHIILYKPFLKTMTERDDLVKTALDAAKSADEKRKKLLETIEQDMADVRRQAKEVMADARSRGAEEQRKRLEAAQAEAAGIAERATAELRAATETARQKLRADVDVLARTIAERLVRGQS